MPVINFHLIENANSAQQEQMLLKQAAQFYAEVLNAPMERIRAFITYHAGSRFFVAGELASENALNAPFFEFFVLEGRPVEERQRLLAGFTELIEDTLDVLRKQVRGMCHCVNPDNWAIAGVPASNMRKAEIDARKRAAGNS